MAGRWQCVRRLPAASAFVAALVAATASPALGQSSAAAQAVSALPACREGLVTAQVPVPPSVRVTDNHVNVLLPPGYCSSAKRYPVLYLLHGAGDTYQAWSSQTDIVSFARGFPVIIVMPDGGHNELAGWYSNWIDGEYQWETYHTQTLPHYVDRHFRTLRRDLAVAGLSMGGFGALSYAGRHPGMYRAAASFSGAVDTLYGAPASGVVFTEMHAMYGTPDDRIWGSQLTNQSVWAAHNPASLAPSLAGTRLFLASGTGTPGGAYGDDPSNPGAYVLENGVFQMNLSLVRALDQGGVAHTDDFYAGGYHGWPYWQADLHWALPGIAHALGPPQP